MKRPAYQKPVTGMKIPTDQRAASGKYLDNACSSEIDEFNERLVNAGLDYRFNNSIDLTGVANDDLILNISAHNDVSRVAFEYFADLIDANRFALQLACRYNWPDVADLLLQRKVPIDLSQQRQEDESPLIIAAFYNFTSIAKMLIEYNADVTKITRNGKTALHLASQHGNEELCEILLNQPYYINGVHNINKKDHAGKTSLHLAMLSGERGKKVTSLLLAKGADVMIKDQDKDGRCALLIAAGEGSSDMIEMLLNKVPREGKKRIQDDMNQALFIAVQGGCEDVVNTLIDHGANVNTAGEGSLTPLHVATINGHVSIVKKLLSRHADVNAVDHRDMSPFHRACLNGHLEIVKLDIWRKSTYLNSVDEAGNVPLMLAILNGRKEVVDYLMDTHARLGVSLDMTDKKGYNILHKAVKSKQVEVLKLVLAKVKDNLNVLINGKDVKYQRTPVHHAAKYPNEKLVELLITQGVDINVLDANQQTPLRIASNYGHVSCFLSLMKANNGRDGVPGCNQADVDGNTPLHYAAEQRSLKTMEAILEGCTDVNTIVNAVNKNNETPLHLACRRNCVVCVTFLLDNDADVSVKTAEKTCLDEAAESRNYTICTTLINHSSTLEVLWKDVKFICCMQTLIKEHPHVANEILDKCYRRTKNDEMYLFGILDKIEDNTGRTPKRYFAPAVMLSHFQDDLITHDVTTKLIHRIWNKFGQWVYFIWFFINAVYTTFLTALVVIGKDNESLMNSTDYNDINKTCRMTRHEQQSRVFSWILVIIGIVYVLIQVVYIYQLRMRYLTVGNLWRLLISVLTLLFILPFVACHVDSLREFMRGKENLRWQFGALAILLSWINLLVHFKHLFFGLYVVMLLEVLKSWIKIISVFGILIVGFALSFHCVLDERASLNKPGISIITTVVWMIGEFDYDDIFLDTDLKYQNTSVFILIIFFIIMNITFINLLVGLAVGDIHAVRKRASLVLLKEKIDSLEVIHNCMPLYFRRKLHEKCYIPKAGLFGGIFHRFDNAMMTKIGNDYSTTNGENDYRQINKKRRQTWRRKVVVDN